jgi:cytosine/adenosine deaminase-related metal-dependent hydrolase
MIAIDGAHVLGERDFRVGTVAIDGGTIAALAFSSDERSGLRAGAREVVDGNGCWLIPGLVDSHTHAYGTLLRGTESALPLEGWSLYTIAYGGGLDHAAIEAAMLLHDAECIRSGITGVVDHFPHLAHARAAYAAHERSGMRVLFAVFLQDLSDYDLLAIDVPPALRDLATVAPVDPAAYEAWFADLLTTAAAASGRVRVALGPNAPQRCSPALWSLWRELRERYGVAVHAHALETRAQARLALQRWPDGGMIAAMETAGLLAPGLSLAHAIWTTDAERERLARCGVAAVHNPLSNLTLGSGVMPLAAYLAAGVRVGLGTDAANCAGRHDLFETMRAARTLPRVHDADPAGWPHASAVMRMATANGMAILGYGDAPPGIVAGAPADLVLIRHDRTATVMSQYTLDGFIAQAGREAIEAVMIDGRWVLRDDRILAFDEGRMLAAVAGAHGAIAERARELTPAIDAGMPGIAEQLRPWLAPLPAPSPTERRGA